MCTKQTLLFITLFILEHMSLGALGDSFYEYLLKAWIQSGQTDTEAREMYDDAMVAIMDNMVQTTATGLVYVSDLKFERLDQKMDHLACFSGNYMNLVELCFDNRFTGKMHSTL